MSQPPVEAMPLPLLEMQRDYAAEEHRLVRLHSELIEAIDRYPHQPNPAMSALIQKALSAYLDAVDAHDRAEKLWWAAYQKWANPPGPVEKVTEVLRGWMQ